MFAALPKADTITFETTQEEKDALRAEMNELFDLATGYVRRGECDMLVLDEMCSAVSTGMVDLERVLAFLDEGHAAEIVLTGREPAQEMKDRADYITEMTKIKHPFDEGASARIGVEW